MTTSSPTQESFDTINQAWSRMIGCITHDLTTPFACLRMSSQIFEKTIPTLLSIYQKAMRHHPDWETLPDRDIEAVRQIANTTIIKQTNESLAFLNSITNFKEQLLSSPEDPILNIQDCIQKALKDYPFLTEQERNLVFLKNQTNFNFQSAPFFIDILLDHLIDNAVYRIRQVNKGNITLWVEQDDHFNILRFKDTAKGMNENQLARIFSRFFSKRHGKVIPGLGFCRLKWLHMGGDIVCTTSEGEYTDYHIKFPKLNH